MYQKISKRVIAAVFLLSLTSASFAGDGTELDILNATGDHTKVVGHLVWENPENGALRFETFSKTLKRDEDVTIHIGKDLKNKKDYASEVDITVFLSGFPERHIMMSCHLEGDKLNNLDSSYSMTMYHKKDDTKTLYCNISKHKK